MLYKYNNTTLTFEKIKLGSYIKVALLVLFIGSAFGFTTSLKINQLVEKIPVIIRPNEQELTVENVKNKLKQMNIKFPEVILQQIMVESGFGKSTVYKENNNLVGMRYPNLRPTTAIGENRTYCVYKNWEECIVDIALWQTQNAKGIRSQEEYYQLLDAVYSESGNNYSTALKRVKL